VFSIVMSIANTKCDLEDCSFICVEKVARLCVPCLYSLYISLAVDTACTCTPEIKTIPLCDFLISRWGRSLAYSVGRNKSISWSRYSSTMYASTVQT